MTEDERSGRVEAVRRGDLAAAAVTAACELACLVRDSDRVAIGEFLSRRTEPQIRALLVVMAAMMPVDTMSDTDMLSWVTWDELGRPLTAGPSCGTFRAYRRHVAAGELVDDACDEAQRTYYAERYRRRKRAAKARAAATEAAA